MAEDFQPPFPESEPTKSWLARNRKFVILGGLVVVIGIAAVTTTLLLRREPASTVVITNNASGTIPVTTTNTNLAPRPTFQRSTIVNTPSTVLPAYTPPTQQELKNSIDKLKKK